MIVSERAFDFVISPEDQDAGEAGILRQGGRCKQVGALRAANTGEAPLLSRSYSLVRRGGLNGAIIFLREPVRQCLIEGML